MPSIESVGVIGAGQMGAGIAHIFALGGYQVQLVDIAQKSLENAKTSIEKNLSRQASKGQIRDSKIGQTMDRLNYSLEDQSLKDCQIVMEAATENEDVKTKILERLCRFLDKETLLCTNTSSLSITKLAATTDRPEKFMGVHFMNPVPVMTLVELIRGLATSKETYETVKKLVEGLGKVTTDAEDFPAFIVNRILMPMVNEAIYTLYEGVGNVKSIDQSMRLGAKHPMGPLELADFIGLDTCLAIMQVLNDGLSDSKYRPCPLLTKYVEAGWLGRKSGRGFYDYSQTPPEPTR